MSPFIRLNHNYFFLIACVLAVALLCQFRKPQTGACYTEASAPSPAQQRQIHNKALGNVVGGAIGIQKERGDSVFVYSR